MKFPLESEMVAAERERAWDTAKEQHHLLSKPPRQPHFWRRRIGSMIGLMGAWLIKWCEWLAAFEYRQAVAVEREYSGLKQGGYHV